MNYENISVEDLKDLASNNPQEFMKIPIEIIRKITLEHEIEEGKKKGYFIDDSGIIFDTPDDDSIFIDESEL